MRPDQLMIWKRQSRSRSEACLLANAVATVGVRREMTSHQGGPILDSPITDVEASEVRVSARKM